MEAHAERQRQPPDEGRTERKGIYTVRDGRIACEGRIYDLTVVIDRLEKGAWNVSCVLHRTFSVRCFRAPRGSATTMRQAATQFRVARSEGTFSTFSCCPSANLA